LGRNKLSASIYPQKIRGEVKKMEIPFCKDHTIPLKMKRIYVCDSSSGKTKWVKLGWFCPSCRKVELTEEENEEA